MLLVLQDSPPIPGDLPFALFQSFPASLGQGLFIWTLKSRNKYVLYCSSSFACMRTWYSFANTYSTTVYFIAYSSTFSLPADSTSHHMSKHVSAQTSNIIIHANTWKIMRRAAGKYDTRRRHAAQCYYCYTANPSMFRSVTFSNEITRFAWQNRQYVTLVIFSERLSHWLHRQFRLMRNRRKFRLVNAILFLSVLPNTSLH